MKQKQISIGHIPAILWGDISGKLIIAVHGNKSHKEDVVIETLASIATNRNYQVLSFDLPEHGDRKVEGILCKVQTCVFELESVMEYAKTVSTEISLFACSIGAYFSLLAYSSKQLQQAIFLSPVVDMERIICNMMSWSGISEAQLKKEQEIPTPTGQVLYWDYYTYIKSHPASAWGIPTWILYGEKDTVSERDCIETFVAKHSSNLTILKNAEHFFHTSEQIKCFSQWLELVIQL